MVLLLLFPHHQFWLAPLSSPKQKSDLHIWVQNGPISCRSTPCVWYLDRHGKGAAFTAGALQTFPEFQRGGLAVVSQRAQPNHEGQDKPGRGGQPPEESWMLRAGCVCPRCLLPVMMTDDVPSRMSPRPVCTEQLLFGLCCPTRAPACPTYTSWSSCEMHPVTCWKVTAPSRHGRCIFMRTGREEPGLCSNCAEQYSKSQSCLAVQMFLETPTQCIPD